MTSPESQSHPVTVHIQKVLDENAQLILIIQEYQRKGRNQDSIEYQKVLRRNLICLASVAGLNINLDLLLPPLITDVYSSVRYNSSLHQDVQRQGQYMQQQKKYNQQSPSRLMYTQETGQMMNGSHYRPSISPIRPLSQQHIPLFQYQGQLKNTNIATTNNSLVGYNQSGYMCKQPSNQFSRAHDCPVLVISSTYLNPNYINLTNPPYQSYAIIPYENQPSSSYSQNSTVSSSQNFSNNYFPVCYVQQQVNSNSKYGQVTNNKPSYTYSQYTPQTTYTTTQTVQSYTNSGYTPQITYTTTQTVQSYTNNGYTPQIPYTTTQTVQSCTNSGYTPPIPYTTTQIVQSCNNSVYIPQITYTTTQTAHSFTNSVYYTPQITYTTTQTVQSHTNSVYTPHITYTTTQTVQSYTNSGYTPQTAYTQTVQSPTISSSGYFQETNQNSPCTSSEYDQVTNQVYSYSNSEYASQIEYSTSHTTQLQRPIGEYAPQTTHAISPSIQSEIFNSEQIEYSTSHTTQLQRPIGEYAPQTTHTISPSIQSEIFNSEHVQVPNQMPSYTSSDYDLQMTCATSQTTHSEIYSSGYEHVTNQSQPDTSLRNSTQIAHASCQTTQSVCSMSTNIYPNGILTVQQTPAVSEFNYSIPQSIAHLSYQSPLGVPNQQNYPSQQDHQLTLENPTSS